MAGVAGLSSTPVMVAGRSTASLELIAKRVLPALHETSPRG
jgi:hypothetical protein